MEIVFWLCIGGIAATYVAYPLIIVLLANLYSAEKPGGGHTPTVTMVINAYNEEAVIRAKLENTLAIDYPGDLLEVLVISDESTDATDEIVREFADRSVRLLRQEPRGGKSRGLTRFVPVARGEILIFSDANSMYDGQAVRELVRPFSDETVGYVVGHQRYQQDDESPVSVSERLYWWLEVELKRGETQVGSVVGGDGAIYAIRKRLFRPLEDDDLSDFVLPLEIVVAGYRGVFQDSAHCSEDVAGSFSGEFRRKVRIVNRALTAVMRVPAALNPAAVGWFALQLFFHKVLRWFVPYLLLVALAANIGLVISGDSVFYVYLLCAQAVLYAIAALGGLRGLRQFAPIYVLFYFCLVNVAALQGTLRALRGHSFSTWQPERG